MNVTVVAKGGAIRKVLIPKKHGQKIKQSSTNIFSTDEWPSLSKNERETKPPAIKSEPEAIPFFCQPSEPAAVTLHNVLFKDLDGTV